MYANKLIDSCAKRYIQSEYTQPLTKPNGRWKKTTYLFTKRELESELFVNLAAAVYYKFTEQVYNFKKFNKTSVLTN